MLLVDILQDALTTGTGTKRHLLVEAPFRSGSEMLPSMVAGVMARGLVPLFAHPERCSAFDPARDNARSAFSFLKGRSKTADLQGTAIMKLHNSGCRFQGNLGSFAGVYGNDIKQRAVLFLNEGVYSCMGSDAHRSERLDRVLSDGLETVVATIGEVAAFELLSGVALK